MDTSNVPSLLEQLDDEVDDLEESLDPLMSTALSETSPKLPLLDRAKLYVLVTYAIESLLFSYLRLNGVKAREHSVFTELTRVKQYFEKLKRAETPIAGKRTNLSLDRGAAARIISAGLSGNDKWDLERAERQAKDRVTAHIKFEESTASSRENDLSKKRNAEDASADSSSPDLDSDSSAEDSEPQATAPQVLKKKKRKVKHDASSDSVETAVPVKGQKGRQHKKKAKKRNKKNKTTSFE